MEESDSGRPLVGWQRAHVVRAAEYLRTILSRTPDDERGALVYQGLLEVLEPARYAARRHRERREDRQAGGSMWDQRSGRERRRNDRRRVNLCPPADKERRKAERRSGRDRRAG